MANTDPVVHSARLLILVKLAHPWNADVNIPSYLLMRDGLDANLNYGVSAALITVSPVHPLKQPLWKLKYPQLIISTTLDALVVTVPNEKLNGSTSGLLDIMLIL